MELAKLFIFPLLVSSAVAYFTTPLVIKLAWKWNLIDDPAKNKHPKVIHTKKIPRGGGLAIFISLILASFIFLPIDKHLLAISLGALIITTIGLADDKYNIHPLIRLLVQFTAALIPILAGIGITFISNPAGGVINFASPLFSDILAVFWIVILMNFLNMGAKGVDGQLSGVVVVAALTIAALSLKFSADITEWPATILASILTGAFLGFLPWHKFPQKIMPSFSGSSLAGYYLGILSILTTTKIGTLALVLAVPLVDTGYIIIKRILSGKSPIWGDRGHLHHRLLDSGWSINKISYFYWIVTAILGLIALFLGTALKLYTLVGVAFLLGGSTLWLTKKRK